MINQKYRDSNHQKINQFKRSTLEIKSLFKNTEIIKKERTKYKIK
jgi:hypothetical protein